MMKKLEYNKPALSYEEQIKQLEERGLYIENKPKTIHLLENISYYRLSAYWYPLLENPKTEHKFKPNSSFSKAFKLYCFDRELRNLVSSEIEKIEISIRAKLIHILSRKNGPFWYQKERLFSKNEKYQKSITKLTKEYKRSDADFKGSFSRNYSNLLPPSWMLLEVSSFGNLSSIFSNLKASRDKRTIANYYGLDERSLESWLHTLTYVRNVCTHHSRFWNKRMSIQPTILKKPKNKFITITSLPNPNGGNPWRINDRAYFVLCMLLYLLNIVNPNHTFKIKLTNLFEKYPYTDLKALGFPEHWEKEPIWD